MKHQGLIYSNSVQHGRQKPLDWIRTEHFLQVRVGYNG